MNQAEIEKAFPPGRNTETDNVAMALVRIFATWAGIQKREKELGPRFSAFVKFKLGDEERSRALVDICLEIHEQMKEAAEAMLDAAITLDIALLDRAVAKKLDEQFRGR